MKCTFQFQNSDKEAAWQNILYDANYSFKNQAMKIAMLLDGNSEISDETTFRADGATSKNIRSSVYHLLSHAAPNSASASPLFIQTVQQVLNTARLLSFS
jgi:hypothetical protein